MVFKKDLTPIGGKRGTVTKHRGKGSTVQRVPPGERESVTGGSSLDRMQGRFPKPAPAPALPPGPAPGPPGWMPPFGIGQPPEEV
jgi:hypothetical protein